jgi:uncharacterized protein (TIGR02001 family)
LGRKKATGRGIVALVKSSGRAALGAAGLFLFLGSASPAFAEEQPGRAALQDLGETPLDIYTTFAVDSVGVFRGVKSDRLNPAVWASLDIEWSDFYAGVFGQPTGFETETVPLFYGYGGFAPTFRGVDFNVGASYYAFPWSSPAEFDVDADDIVDHSGRKGLFEAFGGLSKDLGFAEIEALAFYSPNMYGETGRAWYFAGEVSAPLPKGFTFAAHYGASEFAQDQYNDDYSDYAVGIEKSLFGFDMSLKYSNVADLAGADEAAVVFSISREFSIFSTGKRREGRMDKIRNNWVVNKGLFARR